ncbi:hypothetical protein DM02DRAFT_661823 [Periconia macrospinosa]|uniref:Cyanovirin-N domain-containing protein n=1 Tax=Periconia macrospinosa TaxID=97972 RepID=A0A2V1D691_9PLEO|nr:hypothetical protein DM02DRAFT_661823 [Periconia macrospinosa]
MKSLSLVVALTLKAYSAYATPVATEAVVVKPISSECINIRFQLNWLVAECLTGKDNMTRQKTAIWLHSYVENDHGTMKWKPQGYFDYSCRDCQLGGTTLTCTCDWFNPVKSSLDLSERIAVYNGYLMSDVGGTPTPPKVPSKYPVPDDFRYVYGGENYCVYDGKEDQCQAYAQFRSCFPTFDSYEGQWSNEPRNCHVPTVWSQQEARFVDFKFLAGGDWVVEGFDDYDCKGNVTVRHGVGSGRENGECVALGKEKAPTAFRILPAFDAAYIPN